jgi:Lon protease-like protein
VGARLIEILPLNLADKQRYLELLDPLERLELISPMIRRAGEEAD